MNKIRIYIEELGPIRKQEIELAQVMLFTGDSNLGKSYTNFLCYYLLSLASSNRLDEFLKNKIIGYNGNEEFSFVVKTSDIRLWMEDDVRRFFQYLLAYPDVACNVHFYFEDAAENIKVSFKETSLLDESNNALSMIHLNVNGSETDIGYNVVYKDDTLLSWIKYYFMRELLGEFISKAYLMPPGRASLLSSSYTSQKDISRMGMYDIFLKDNDLINYKVSHSMSLAEDQQFFQSRIKRLIGAELKVEKEGPVLVLESGQSIPLQAVASSIKELSPILMWMQGTTSLKFESICIEEPEAHCHPMMQSRLADLLVACINKGVLMQITTHSDYLLKRLNMLIRLKDLYDNDMERYDEFCKKYQHTRTLMLDKSAVKSYYFHYSEETKSVEVTLQDLSEGIPFDSFTAIINNEIEFDNFISGEDADI